ncbi:hypothetical protein N9355_02830 [Crocinitomicaceae bacterium]|nr:hypothetical protein [Crocinitomicaceae bacterium]
MHAILPIFLVLLISLSCQKEVKPDYQGDYDPYDISYDYYYLKGVVKDTFGIPMNAVAVQIDGPCVAPAITDTNGYYVLRTCETTSKWSFTFEENVTIWVKDTANFDAIGFNSFPSNILVEDDTVTVDIEL